MRKGITLTELMISVAIISIGVLGLVGTFKYFNISIQSAKYRSLANNLAQEKLEYIKNKSYYRILTTTATATDNNFSPALIYDVAPNGIENLNVGGIDFTRRVYIRKVSENVSGDLTYLSWNSPDAGLKEINVQVVWRERSSWRKLEVRSLADNPARTNLSATFSGRVYDAATMANISSAIVRAQENPSQYAETDVNGNYSFIIEPGSYTLVASMDGYFSKTTGLLSVNAAQTLSGQDFALTQMSSGTITGTAWKRDHLVISQVVGATVNAAGFCQEYVELYNPTTYYIQMVMGMNASLIKLKMRDYGEWERDITLQYSVINSSVPPNRYYLIANTGIVTVGGVMKVADAVYSPTNVDYPEMIRVAGGSCGESGGDADNVWIADTMTNAIIDSVGWDTNPGTPHLPFVYETNAIDQTIGLQENEQFIRKTRSGAMIVGVGRAYDSNNNNNDFYVLSPISYGPKNSSDSEAPTTGTPAAGALIFTDDSLSSPVIANSAGAFNLTNVATGTWKVYISSDMAFSSVAYYGGTSNGFVASAGDIGLTSPTTYGYVTGRVTNVSGTNLSNIKMYSPGMSQVPTDSTGKYILPVQAGITNIIANYQNQSPNYVEFSSMDVTVALGAVTKDVDFTLVYGGKISGRITTNGVDPLPNIPVVALKGGVEQGNGISDSNGYFLIAGAGISTGTYTVYPQLEVGESCSPSSSTITLGAGVTTFVATYTVTGAYGYITGTVRRNSTSGPLITTGVLIYATTSTISSTPPDINSVLRSGTAVYYADSSSALGTYTVAVRGGNTYNLYAWYTTWSGDTPTTVRKEYEGVSAFTVNPGQTVTKNFFW